MWKKIIYWDKLHPPAKHPQLRSWNVIALHEFLLVLHELLGPQPAQRYKLLPHLGTICGIKKEKWLNRGFSCSRSIPNTKENKNNNHSLVCHYRDGHLGNKYKLRGLSIVSTHNFTASSSLSSANNELVGIWSQQRSTRCKQDRKLELVVIRGDQNCVWSLERELCRNPSRYEPLWRKLPSNTVNKQVLCGFVRRQRSA